MMVWLIVLASAAEYNDGIVPSDEHMQEVLEKAAQRTSLRERFSSWRSR